MAALRRYYNTTSSGQQFLEQADPNVAADNQFLLCDGLVYYKHCLFIPLDSRLRPTLLHEYHGSPLDGHFSVKATTVRLAAFLYCPTLVQDVKQHVQECLVCQQTKYLAHKPYGQLQPLPIPHQVWDDLSMDFITTLPLSMGKTTVWVIVDRLTKFAHVIALAPNYTTASLASIFLTDVHKLHGLPRSIVSDRDLLFFVSKFWRELFRLLGTTLKFSNSYHPQSDGQTEVVNRCLESYLHSFVCDEPRRWARFLPLAEFWYNTSYHSSLQMSPFQALYGRPLPTAFPYLPGSTTVDSLETTLTARKAVLTDLKSNLQVAQHRMTQQQTTLGQVLRHW